MSASAGEDFFEGFFDKGGVGKMAGSFSLLKVEDFECGELRKSGDVFGEALFAKELFNFRECEKGETEK